MIATKSGHHLPGGFQFPLRLKMLRHAKAVIQITRIRNEPNMFDSFESPAIPPFAAMAKRASKSTKRELPEEIPGQAERLRRLQAAFGFPTSAAFAAFLDVGVTRWNGFLNGSPLSRDMAFRLVRKFPGLSLDWLYFGKIEALPVELARRLGELDPPKRSS